MPECDGTNCPHAGAPVRVLDPSKRIDGIGKGVKEGRIWTYVRDDRPWGSTAPPGAAYFFSVDRKRASEPEWGASVTPSVGVPTFSARTFLSPNEMKPAVWLRWQPDPILSAV